MRAVRPPDCDQVLLPLLPPRPFTLDAIHELRLTLLLLKAHLLRSPMPQPPVPPPHARARPQLPYPPVPSLAPAHAPRAIRQYHSPAQSTARLTARGTPHGLQASSCVCFLPRARHTRNGGRGASGLVGCWRPILIRLHTKTLNHGCVERFRGRGRNICTHLSCRTRTQSMHYITHLSILKLINADDIAHPP